MKLPTLKYYVGGALMLTAVFTSPVIFKVDSASALPPQITEELNFTPEQQANLDAIKESARTQVEAMLTEPQRAALAGTTGRDRAQAMRRLDLSEDQRTQLQAIREESREAVDAVFTDEQQVQLQAMRAKRMEGNKNLREEIAEELNLTSEQQAELEAIKENARTQVEAVLTEEQLSAIDGQTGRERMQAMRSLDLSEDQRAQLQEIREESRAAADAVFTDEQRAQLQEMRETRGARRGNR